jgi:beta-glucosidase
MDMRKVQVLLLCMTFFFAGSSLALRAQQTAQNLEQQIEELLAQLTLEEKVAMCHAQSKFSSKGVPRLGIPELWMSDGPHGVRAEMAWDSWNHAGWTNDSITAFPALTCLAATFSPELSYQYGQAIGEEALYRRKDVLLGPGVNIYRTPLNGRNFEYMGEDPHLASVMVVPYIKGVQENGVATCVKHYVLNNQERWRDHINVKVSKRALYEIYLPAFKAAADGGAWSFMGAYNQYLGQFCSHNEYLINEVLKGDWGYDGALITDWGATHDTRQAALYGLDIEMGTGTNGLTTSTQNHYNNYYLAHPFLEMLKKGEVPESVLDDKVRRILRLMLRTSMNPNRGFGKLNTAAHQQVSREVAREGIVLLKNENDFFPLDPSRDLTIAVIGENATRPMTPGGGSSELKPKYEISPLQGLQERFKNATILHSMGYASGPPVYARVVPSPYDADSLRKAAVAVASQADVVLFFGGLNKNHHQDCEGGDRLQYGLPFGQEQLIRELQDANEKLGVILISGNAVATPWRDRTPGIMQGWFLGSEAGRALVDVISGDVNPSGKLPFSFPEKLEDNSAHHFDEMAYPGDSIDVEYKEGILVGYRWHDTQGIEPAFAFGHGLSYTQFELEAAQTDKKSYAAGEQIQLSCTLANTGERAGAEVIQLYVGKPKSEVERAEKELKAFEKVRLEKGAKATVRLSLSTDELAYYDASRSDWKLEPGTYVLYVGNASNNIWKKLKITIK